MLPKPPNHCQVRTKLEDLWLGAWVMELRQPESVGRVCWLGPLYVHVAMFPVRDVRAVKPEHLVLVS